MIVAFMNATLWSRALHVTPMQLTGSCSTPLHAESSGATDPTEHRNWNDVGRFSRLLFNWIVYSSCPKRLYTRPSDFLRPQSQPAFSANMLAKAATRALQIAPIQTVDRSAWTTLFRAYIDFYGASIPETQYQSTFDRLVDPAKDLHCLVLRTPDESGGERKLFGIAHFYPHQTPWSEKPIMHLNGKILRQRPTS